MFNLNVKTSTPLIRPCGTVCVSTRPTGEEATDQVGLRAERLGLVQGGAMAFPINQQHIADALGLSLVHTNKTLRKLEKRGLHEIKDGRLYLRDVKALARLADLYGDGHPPQRPLV